jgi:hypothetical protein
MGDDRFRSESVITDVNKYEKLNCEICDTEMEVERNNPPHNNLVGAWAGTNRYYDEFSCPHRHEGWHYQAQSILEEADKTHSKVLRDMLRAEAKEILKTRVATIDYS